MRSLVRPLRRVKRCDTIQFEPLSEAEAVDGDAS